MSNPNSPTEDVALPDAPPADPSAEAEGVGSTSEDDTKLPVPKTELQTDPPEPASSPLPNVKEEEIVELENLFADDDDDEDFFGETNDADMLASEVGAVYVYVLTSPSFNILLD
jgi:DNA primase small subunit